MRHINTRQIDNHLWHIEVTDGYHVQWTAVMNSNQSRRLELYRGEKDYGKPVAYVLLNGSSESERLGDAVALVFNWDQFGLHANELLDKRWVVEDPHLALTYSH